MHLIAGTFNSPLIYWLHFDPKTESLTVTSVSKAVGGHSWLALSKNQKFLYCTAWTTPEPSIAAYRVNNQLTRLEFINNKPVPNRPGYVCCSDTHVYSVGGNAGQVFSIQDGGGIGDEIQQISFTDPHGENMSEKRGVVAHGDFGGLRHGAHSCDLSPHGCTLYVADIGRNCVWAYGVGESEGQNLTLHRKEVAPREYDGPRHTWPHPNGKILYSLQEHSSMVDAFQIERDEKGRVTKLTHIGGVNILPRDKDRQDFWADEVRLSSGPDPLEPEYLYGSTRGLVSGTKGYVSVFRLNKDGTFASEAPVDIWTTPTCGGIANAIEPAPWVQGQCAKRHIQYLSLTDSEDGKVLILRFDGERIREVSQLKLSPPEALRGETNGISGAGETNGVYASVIEAATTIWLRPNV